MRMLKNFKKLLHSFCIPYLIKFGNESYKNIFDCNIYITVLSEYISLSSIKGKQL